MFARSLSILACLVFLGCQEPDEMTHPGSEQPLNVLIILVDDLRPDLAAYGHVRVHSPAIDRLAARGLRFDRAFAQAPVCNPSRTSLLTGLRPDTTGVLDNRTSVTARISDPVTLPRFFRRQGYFTASIGKVFHGAGRRGMWTDAGSWDLETVPVGRRPTEASPPPAEQGRVGRYRWQSATGRNDRFADVRVTRQVVAVLEEPRQKPLFMMVGLTATHPHFEAPSRFFDLYPLDSVEPPPPPPPGARRASYATSTWSDQEHGRFSEAQQRELLRAYWACVSFVDEQIGKILSALERLDMADSTVVVLTSDHGYHLGENDWWSKHTLYDASLRVPLVIAAPGMRATGRGTQRLVELIDLFPTLVELSAAEVPAGLAGRSLLPLLADPDQPWKPAALSQMLVGRVMGRSVRTERWRYTEWDGGSRGVELYDHQSDPGELDNLAGDLRHEDVRRRLADLLR